jgi:hypothetical protein
LLLLLAGSGAAGWRAYQASRFFSPELLFSRFPAEEATALGIDFAALRKAGLLTESKTPLETEYKAFLEGTGFDYRCDLDYLAAAFSKSGNYFIARGRFDREKLRAYAIRQGGSCYELLCRMQGSQPDRHISFLPLRDDALALAVGPDDLAATRLTKTGQPVSGKLPNTPVWMSVPGPMLQNRQGVPPGVRLMLSALSNAERVELTINAAGGGIEERFEARFEARCHTADESRTLTSELKSTTAAIRQLNDNDDLVRALAAGTFEQAGTRVTGRWPMTKSLIESLTEGI